MQKDRSMPDVQDEFFTDLKEWSERKLELLQRYLDSAVKIMQVMSKGPVYYVDCFAGRGSYGSSTGAQVPGSPLRAAMLARKYDEEGKSYALHCINVEEDLSNFYALAQATQPFQKYVQNLPGTFVQNVDYIITSLGNAPTICFIDPFGVDGMDWTAVQKLLRRRSPTDIWIRFDVDAIRRRAGWYKRKDDPAWSAHFDILSRAYGITDHDKLYQLLENHATPEARKMAALNLYMSRVRADMLAVKRESYVYAYRIGSIHQETKYYLVCVTSNKKGAILASNIVYDVEEDYKLDVERFKESTERQLNMFNMIDPSTDEIFSDKVKRLKETIIQTYRGQALSIRDLHAGILQEWFGIIKGKHVTQAVRELAQPGGIVTLSGRPSDDKTIVTFRP